MADQVAMLDQLTAWRDPQRPGDSPTFLEHGSARMLAVADAMGFDQQTTLRMLDVFRFLTWPWGSEPLGRHPFWPSDITDDHTPYEFSYALEPGSRELRVLLEARPETPDVFAQWRAAQLLNERLEREYGVCLDRVRAVQDLFAPTWAGARFGMWHSSMICNGETPRFKLYFNPCAHGPERADATIRCALERLGFPETVLDRLELGNSDQIVYLSLDLADGPSARVKIYVAHRNATVEDIEAAVSHADGPVAGEATIFCRTLAMHGGPYEARPVLSCFTFLAGRHRPVAATVHFPVRSYVGNDQMVADRIRFLMSPEDWAAYLRVIDAFRHRDLESGVGMHTYASFRREAGEFRLTLYLACEAYGTSTAA